MDNELIIQMEHDMVKKTGRTANQLIFTSVVKDLNLEIPRINPAIIPDKTFWEDCIT